MKRESWTRKAQEKHTCSGTHLKPNGKETGGGGDMRGGPVVRYLSCPAVMIGRWILVDLIGFFDGLDLFVRLSDLQL